MLGASGIPGPQGATGPMGAHGYMGVTGPSGPSSLSILLSVPIIGHTDFKLELQKEISWKGNSYVVRVSGPESKSNRWYGLYSRSICLIDDQSHVLSFNWLSKLENELLKTRNDSEKLCILTLFDAVTKAEDGSDTPPLASDVLYDPFWKTFIEDAVSMVIVTDILLI